ncbi:hypothetical protein [Halomonas sp. BM-2019]
MSETTLHAIVESGARLAQGAPMLECRDLTRIYHPAQPAGGS